MCLGVWVFLVLRLGVLNHECSMNTIEIETNTVMYHCLTSAPNLIKRTGIVRLSATLCMALPILCFNTLASGKLDKVEMYD